jgi:hypothetical protein
MPFLAKILIMKIEQEECQKILILICTRYQNIFKLAGGETANDNCWDFPTGEIGRNLIKK